MEPWTALEPLLICKAIAAPPARPCSASNELLTTLTSWTASRAGIYVKVLSMTPRLLVPSMEKLLILVGVPLTEKFTERIGYPADRALLSRSAAITTRARWRYGWPERESRVAWRSAP